VGGFGVVKNLQGCQKREWGGRSFLSFCKGRKEEIILTSCPPECNNSMYSNAGNFWWNIFVGLFT
jgi:hypothetical protein